MSRGLAPLGSVCGGGAELWVLKDGHSAEEDDESLAIDAVDGHAVLLSGGLAVQRGDDAVREVCRHTRWANERRHNRQRKRTPTGSSMMSLASPKTSHAFLSHLSDYEYDRWRADTLTV